MVEGFPPAGQRHGDSDGGKNYPLWRHKGCPGAVFAQIPHALSGMAMSPNHSAWLASHETAHGGRNYPLLSHFPWNAERWWKNFPSGEPFIVRHGGKISPRPSHFVLVASPHNGGAISPHGIAQSSPRGSNSNSAFTNFRWWKVFPPCWMRQPSLWKEIPPHPGRG